MDLMDGLAVLAIAALWLLTWASVVGCEKLGERK